VKELSLQNRMLTAEKAALEAEVEIYRKEAALPNFSSIALGNKSMEVDNDGASKNNNTAFLKSGNGIFCQNPDVVLSKLHGSANPLTVALSPDETVLVSGGADGSLNLVQWGAVDTANGNAIAAKYTCRVTPDFTAPVICVAVAPPNWIAVGGMDGSVALVTYRSSGPQLTARRHAASLGRFQAHRKYVKAVKWSPNGRTLATCSADGNIHLYTVERGTMMDDGGGDDNDDDDEDNSVRVQHRQSFHLPGPVECLCFASDTVLLAHARGTAVLTQFDLTDDEGAVTEINLNTNHANEALPNGGFADHVSFTVLDLQISPCGQFLALATDCHRHMVLDLHRAGAPQVRNLYGHQADGFSSPVIAWSANSQYLYGSDQHQAVVWVYDVAASKIVSQLQRAHTRPVKALFSSPRTNTLVTTSFDRETVVWLAPAE